MPPLWFWFVLAGLVVAFIAALFIVTEIAKRDMDEVLDCLELRNNMSRAKAFDICKKELK